MTLTDSRTLEALDFAGVRERVVGATHTQRGHARAVALAPEDDYEAVRREQRRTEAVRSLLAGADLHIMRAVDTGPLTESAAVGRTLGASDLRAIGDALAAA